MKMRGVSTARRPRAGGPTPTPRRSTSSSPWPASTRRAFSARSPPLQHRGPSTKWPVRDGHPAFRGGGLAGQPLEVYGDGAQTRCFCHVSDTVRALHALIAEPATAGGIFNVGLDGASHRRPGDARDREDRLEPEIVFVPYEEVFERGIEEEMFHRAPSIDKIAAAVGWPPRPGRDPRRRDRVGASGSGGGEPDSERARHVFPHDDCGGNVNGQVTGQLVVAEGLTAAGMPPARCAVHASRWRACAPRPAR